MVRVKHQNVHIQVQVKISIIGENVSVSGFKRQTQNTPDCEVKPIFYLQSDSEDQNR